MFLLLIYKFASPYYTVSLLIIAADVDHRELSSVLCDDLEGWDGGRSGREDQEGGDMCIIIAASPCCTTETKGTL